MAAKVFGVISRRLRLRFFKIILKFLLFCILYLDQYEVVNVIYVEVNQLFPLAIPRNWWHPPFLADIPRIQIWRQVSSMGPGLKASWSRSGEVIPRNIR